MPKLKKNVFWCFIGSLLKKLQKFFWSLFFLLFSPLKKKHWNSIKNLVRHFAGGGQLFHITKRAIVKKDYKELDEAIKSKVTPYLYNGGQGQMVPIVQLTMIRNRDRPKSKQVCTQLIRFSLSGLIFGPCLSSFHKLRNWVKLPLITSSKAVNCWRKWRKVWILKHVR